MGKKIHATTVIYVNNETKAKWINSMPLFIYIKIMIFYIKVTIDLHSPKLKTMTLFNLRLMGDFVDFIMSRKVLVTKAFGCL